MPPFISKTHLAQAYFPNIHPRAARNKLMQMINDDYHIYSQLLPLGYTRHSHLLSPKMLRIIFDHFGDPFAT